MNIFAGSTAFRKSSNRTKVIESSTLLDVADRILLEEDGDLLTIHHAPDMEAPLQQKDNNQCSNEEPMINKMLQQTEKEMLLTNFASNSPSIQTIISKVGRRIGGTSPTIEILAKAAGGSSTDDCQISPNRVTSKDQWL